MTTDAGKPMSARNRGGHSQPVKELVATPPVTSGQEGISCTRRRVLQQQRRERKHALRREVPRSSHAYCEFAGRIDPVALLERQATTRLPDLIPIRYARM